MKNLRFYYVALSSPFFVLRIIPGAKRLTKHGTEIQRYRYAQKIMNHMRRRGRTKTKVFGKENLPSDCGYIMYSNHQGKYDALGIMLYHDEPCRVLMEKKQSMKIVAKQCIDLVDGKRLDFDNPRQQLKTLKEISEEVKQGKKYLIFPEGGYEDNKNTLQKFNSGCFRCAIDSKCPIVPVTIVDSYKSLNGNSLKRCTTQIHFLPPIFYDEYKEMKKTEISQMVKELIQKKLDEVLA